MKTNCPTLEEVKKLVGISNSELDKKEGIDKRLLSIKTRRQAYLTKQSILKEQKKLRKKNNRYSCTIRIVQPRDIFYCETKQQYFFSYVYFFNNEVSGTTKYFQNYDSALDKLVQIQAMQLGV